MARTFKLGILISTLTLVVALLAATSHGRNQVAWLTTRTRWLALQAVGLPLAREEIEADWRRRRLHDMQQTRGKLRGIYAEYEPPMRRLLDYAGLDPDHALLRWGNFEKTLLLPATVFIPDETGRSYRFRPATRSIWVRNLKLKGGILAYFPIPETPDLPKILSDTGAQVVDTSIQTTNSWGLRGAEPNLAAPLRGIVLGDSYMQGLFVLDHQTPAECLKRRLRDRFKTDVEILNTGHLGYSPEQEFFTLKEYHDRVRPHFVVLSIFANDFGDLFEVLEGKGDWGEGKYWIGEITQYCRTSGIPCLVVPAPWVNQVDGQRKSGLYPGQMANLLDQSSIFYLDPIEEFVAEHIVQLNRNLREGRPTTPSPLFNGHVGDGHFSALGCEVWARAVGRRMGLLLEKAMENGQIPHPPPSSKVP